MNEKRRAQHTPGPWVVSGYRVIADVDPSKAERPVCSCAFHTFQGPGEAKNNARLIAAAPDLLAACRRVLDALNKWSSETGGILWVNDPSAVHESANEVLAAAISKAEGKQA